MPRPGQQGSSERVHVSKRRWAAIGVASALTVAALTLGLTGKIAGDQASSGATFESSAKAVRPSPAGSVLPAADTRDPQPTTAGLQAVLTPLLADPKLGPRVGVSIVDANSGSQLFSKDQTSSYAPASTTKLLTATAALEALGPDRQLVTGVAKGASPNELVLVGAGDPTLTTKAPQPGSDFMAASLQQLAQSTAAALASSGIASPITLRYDARLFAPPTTSPGWPATYVPAGVVAPVTALSVDEGRVTPGQDARVADPPAEAAKRFAALLATAGVVVTGVPSTVDPLAPRPQPAAYIASVKSPTMDALVSQMLTTSDNDLAEALAHLVAVAKKENADFAGAAKAVVDVVASLGIPVAGVGLQDGSGLARSDAVPPATMTAILTKAATTDRLRPILTGLPVGGLTGTLDQRFDTPTTTSGAGYVRGKTGTLSGVSSLAGVVEDADGRLLAFAFLADRVPDQATLGARDALDRLAATLATCGCR